jgi:UDPglucose 6-dehydrogenase
VWGLTYKPGTDTLRRSASVELCTELAGQGVVVQAFDPAVRTLPRELAAQMTLAPTAEAAARNASALVVATEWPDFLKVDLDTALAIMKHRLVLDPNRFLAAALAGKPVEYLAVGVPAKSETVHG